MRRGDAGDRVIIAASYKTDIPAFYWYAVRRSDVALRRYQTEAPQGEHLFLQSPEPPDPELPGRGWRNQLPLFPDG